MSRRSPALSRAFTIVELLVVIGIIATLIAILLPSLKRARDRSRELRCAAILRSWGQAFHTYAAQNRGVLPHTGDRSRNPYGFQDKYFSPFAYNESGYTYVLPPLMNRPSWLDFANGQKPTGDIWQCPDAEVGADVEYGYQPSVLGYHSYAANSFLDNSRLAPTVPGAPVYGDFLRLARAHATSQTLLVYETTLRPEAGYGQAPPGSIVCQARLFSNENARSFGDRHPHLRGKLGGNVMMLDGHVEWRDHLWDPTLPKPEIPALDDRTWWPY